jgi:hypothetical protein
VRDTLLDPKGNGGLGIVIREEESTGDRASLALRASLLERNHSQGVLISGSDATIDSTVVRDTQLDGAGQFGRGVNVQDSVSGGRGSLMLRDSLIERNHNVGVGIFSSDATIETTVVRGTQESDSDVGTFADGITVLGQELLDANVAITDVQIASNARAGLLVVDGAGEISNAHVSGNRFGLVLQGSPQPTIGEGNTFEGNTEQNKIKGGDLPVPSAAPPLP